MNAPAAQLKTLYSLATHPDTQKLVRQHLKLNSFAEQSPLLVRLNNQPTLTQAIEQTPLEWPGLLIESACDTPSVLAHLRQILFVKFDQQRKGILRYSNPTVASYFFCRLYGAGPQPMAGTNHAPALVRCDVGRPGRRGKPVGTSSPTPMRQTGALNAHTGICP